MTSAVVSPAVSEVGLGQFPGQSPGPVSDLDILLLVGVQSHGRGVFFQGPELSVGHIGCQSGRLGCPLSKFGGPRDVVKDRITTEHKLARTKGSMLASQGIQGPDCRPSRAPVD